MGDLSKRYLEREQEGRRQEEASQEATARQARRSIRRISYMSVACVTLAIMLFAPLLMRAFAGEEDQEPQRVSAVPDVVRDSDAEQVVTEESLDARDAVATTTVRYDEGSGSMFQWDGNGDGVPETYRILMVYDRVLDAAEIAKPGFASVPSRRVGDSRGFAIEEIVPGWEQRSPAYLFVPGGHDPELHVSTVGSDPHIDIDYRLYESSYDAPPLRVRLIDGTLMMTEQTVI